MARGGRLLRSVKMAASALDTLEGLPTKIVSIENEQEQDALRKSCSGEIASLMLQGKLTLLRIVESLGALLTSDSSQARQQGTFVLVDVIRATRGVLTEHEVTNVLSFLCERLKDWHTLRATLLACKCLLGAREEPKEDREEVGDESARPSTNYALSKENVHVLARSLFDHVDVQSHSQPNRQLSFELVQAMLAEEYLPVLMEMSDAPTANGDGNPEKEDLLETLVRFVDGEKDPRCLLIAFRCLERSVVAFWESGEADLVESVKRNVEGIADVLSCYFPLSFSPPPEMVKQGITRQDLLLALFGAYTSTPEMFPQVLQLLVDRFPSPKSETKADGLLLLQMCLKKFAPTLRAEMDDPNKKADFDLAMDQAWDLIREQILHTNALLSVVDASCDVLSKALDALRALAEVFSDSDPQKIIDLAFEDEDVKKALVACSSSREQLDRASKTAMVTHCRALDVLSIIASSSLLAFKEVLDRTFSYTNILENISTQPVLMIHYVYKMTCATQYLSDAARGGGSLSGDVLEIFKENLPELCSRLLSYLSIASQDYEDDHKTTSECIKALDNMCSLLSSDPEMTQVLEEVMMGLLGFVLSDDYSDNCEHTCTEECHVMQVGKTVSSLHLTKAGQGAVLMEKILGRTMTALVSSGHEACALLVLSIIAEECTDLSTDIVFKLTKRAIESCGGGGGNLAENKVFCSILTKISLSIMPHLYACKTRGVPKSVAKIMTNLIRLLELVLDSPNIREKGKAGAAILGHVLRSISYTTLVCGEEMQARYADEAVLLILGDGEASGLKLLRLSGSKEGAEKRELRHLLAGAILNPLTSLESVKDVEDVLHSILDVIINTENPQVAEALSVSLSGIVNKLDSNQLDAAVFPLIEGALLCHLKSCEDERAVVTGFGALAWLTRALAMKKYAKVGAILDEMFAILCASPPSLGAEPWGAAAYHDLGEAFAVIVSTDHDEMVDTWKWKAKLLWRQKLFSHLSAKVFAKIDEMRGTRAVVALHQVFSHLIECVHFSVLRPHAREITLNLIHSIPLLIGARLPTEKAIVANLTMLKLALAEEAMRKVVEDHVQAAIEGLVLACGDQTHPSGLSPAYSPSSSGSDPGNGGDRILVRRRALECIALFKDLPHYVVYPYFHPVRRQLQTCLDDSRREVRIQAGRTLRVWTEYVST